MTLVDMEASVGIERKLFETKRGELTIRGMKFRRTDGVKRYVMVISHGFMADSGSVERYAEAFAKAGCICYIFDFCGGGVKTKSDGASMDMTVRTEVEDLLAVISHVRKDSDAERVVLMGCSQGGFVSALCASEHPEFVEKLILYYPALCIPDDARRGKMMFARFNPDAIPKTIKCGPMVLGGEYARCMQETDPFEAIRGYTGPVLILHGTQDRIVNLKYSENAVEAYRSAVQLSSERKVRDLELIAMEGAGHGFKEDLDEKAITLSREFLFRSVPLAGKRILRLRKPCDVDFLQLIKDTYFEKNEYSLDKRFVIRDGMKHPLALIVPGGAYRDVCSFIEGVPYAKELNKMGVSAVILSYRVKEKAHFPNPMDDLAKAVEEIFAKAEEYNIDPENYSVWGSSAGGHLAASFGTEKMGYMHYRLPKPGAIVLAYPVITMDYALTHNETRELLIGAEADEALVRDVSVEFHVTQDFPRTFLWTGDIDATVPAENSRRMASALREAGVEFELEICRGTDHGVGPATGTSAEGWIGRAVKFWRKISHE